MENYIVTEILFIAIMIFGRYVIKDSKRTNEMYHKVKKQ